MSVPPIPVGPDGQIRGTKLNVQTQELRADTDPLYCLFCGETYRA
jgi:hypothetical protein